MSLKEKLFQKKNLWHVGAIAIFFLISSLYLSPTYSGHQIQQSDVDNWAGAAQEILDHRSETGEEALWTNSMFGGMPATQISINNNSRFVFNKVRGAFSLWLPHPIDYFLLSFISFYILSLTLKVKPVIGILGSIAYGLSSFFIIILQVGHNTQLTAVGFAPLVVAGFLMAYRRKKWFTGVALSSLFMALELSANHLQMTYYLGMVLFALGIVELIRHIKEKEIKKFGIVTVGLLVAYTISFGIDYGTIKGTEEYAKYTTRDGTNLSVNANGTEKDVSKITNGLDKDYILHHSYGLDETFTLIIPNFKGGKSSYIGNIESNKSILKDFNKDCKAQIKDLRKNSNPADKSTNIEIQALTQISTDIKSQMQYFGNQPGTSGPVYVGIILVFLALLALFYLDDKLKWALLVVTIITIMLAWGKNLLGFSEFFIDHVPGYNKFRSVTFILFVAELTIPILAILFLSKLIKKREEIKENIKPFFIISGGFVLLLLVFLIIPTLFNTFLIDAEQASLNSIEDPDTFLYYSTIYDSIETVRIAIFRKEVFRGLFFLCIGIGGVFLAIKNKNFANKWLVPVLAIFILLDLVLVDTRYLGTATKGKEAQWTESWKQTYPYTSGAGDQLILTAETQDFELAELISNEVATTKKELKKQKIKGGEANRIVEWHQYRALNRNSNYRVFEQGNPFNSSRTSYFHKSIGGYHGAKLGIYQELIEFHLAQNKNNPSVLDMLNTKYILGYGGATATPNPTALGNAWFVKNVVDVNSSDEEILALCGEYELTVMGSFPILVNGNSISKEKIKGIEDVALVVPNQENSTDTIPLQLPMGINIGDKLSYISTEQGPQWAYTAMLDSASALTQIVQFQMFDKFEPNTNAIIHSEFNLGAKSFSGEGSIVMDEYKPNNLTYTSNSTSEQLAVFSEIYYPHGWSVTIDGKPAEFIRANYVLRALEIPSGEHKIVFNYHVDSFDDAKTFTWIATFLILSLVGGALYLEFKNKEEDSQTVD